MSCQHEFVEKVVDCSACLQERLRSALGSALRLQQDLELEHRKTMRLEQELEHARQALKATEAANWDALQKNYALLDRLKYLAPALLHAHDRVPDEHPAQHSDDPQGHVDGVERGDVTEPHRRPA